MGFPRLIKHVVLKFILSLQFPPTLFITKVKIFMLILSSVSKNNFLSSQVKQFPASPGHKMIDISKGCQGLPFLPHKQMQILQ